MSKSHAPTGVFNHLVTGIFLGILAACQTSPSGPKREDAHERHAREMAALTSLAPAIQATTDSMLALARQGGTPLQATEVASALRQIPGVADATASPGGTAVAVRADNGTQVVQLLYRRNDMALYEPAASARPQNSGNEAGGSAFMRASLTTPPSTGKSALILAPYQSSTNEPLDEIEGVLIRMGFATVRLENSAAGLDAFRAENIAKYDLVYISSHAVAGIPLDPVPDMGARRGTAILTSVPATTPLPNSDRDGVVLALPGGSSHEATAVWAVTPYFLLGQDAKLGGKQTILVVNAPESGLETNGMSWATLVSLTQGGGFAGWRGAVSPDRSDDGMKLLLASLAEGQSFGTASTRVDSDLTTPNLTPRIVTPSSILGVFVGRTYSTGIVSLLPAGAPHGRFSASSATAGDPVTVRVSTTDMAGPVTGVEVSFDGQAPQAMRSTGEGEWISPKLVVPGEGRLPRVLLATYRVLGVGGATVANGTAALVAN